MLQFKIQLKHIDNPAVWRRVIVPEQFSFHKFHKVIQSAFGWQNSHLYEFSPGGFGSQPTIGEPYEEDEEEKLNSKKIKLSKIFTGAKQKFIYIYDFGDSWEHIITLEKITDDASIVADCGGFPGFMDLKKIVSNPKDPEHAEMKEWLGLSKKEKWDANAFDLKEASNAVRNIR